MNKLQRRMLSHGFQIESTGGNCRAYVRTGGDVSEVITIAGDPDIPERLTDVVLLGTYEVSSSREWTEAFDTVDNTEGYTFAQVLKALDNPSDEYRLLSLRLHNNLHR